MSVPVPSTPTNHELREQAKRAVSRAALFDGPATTDEERERRLGVIADAVGEQVYAPVLKGLHAELDRTRAALDRVHENLERIDDGRTGIWASDMRAFLTGVGLGPSTADRDDANLLANPQDASDQTPDDGDPFEIRSHAYRRANVCYECGQPPSAHASDQTPATPDDSHGVRRLIVHPATWDGLVRFLDVRGIEVTPYPDEDGIPTFGMGIKEFPAPSSVQGDTTPTAPDDDELAREYMCRDCGHPKGPFDQDDTWQCDRHRAPSEDTTGGQQ